MKQEKKEVIVKEILLWKENHMLPPHYCDYLLALYTQGEEFTEAGRRSARTRIHMASALLAFLLLPAAIFILYFADLSFLLQTSAVTALIAVLLVLALVFSRKKVVAPLLFLGSAIMLLMLSLELNTRVFQENPLSLYGLILANCLLWVYTGIKLRLVYFTASGSLGFIVVLYFFMTR